RAQVAANDLGDTVRIANRIGSVLFWYVTLRTGNALDEVARLPVVVVTAAVATALGLGHAARRGVGDVVDDVVGDIESNYGRVAVFCPVKRRVGKAVEPEVGRVWCVSEGAVIVELQRTMLRRGTKTRREPV